MNTHQVPDDDVLKVLEPRLALNLPRPVISKHAARRTAMPQSTHNRLAELHNLAAHYHTAAAAAHGKEDHLTAHELSKQAHEHSVNAHKLAEELRNASANTDRATRLDAVVPLRPLSGSDGGLRDRDEAFAFTRDGRKACRSSDLYIRGGHCQSPCIALNDYG